MSMNSGTGVSFRLVGPLTDSDGGVQTRAPGVLFAAESGTAGSRGSNPADPSFGERLEFLDGHRRLQAGHHPFPQAAVQRADELPIVVGEVPERAVSKRDLDGR